MKFSCMMELYKYPLDNQICTMEIASFSKTTRELLLIWNSDIPVDLSSDLRMPQFTVEQVETDNCEESSLIGFHMVQSYVPTILIVVISMGILLDGRGLSSRENKTLGVTTLLTVSSKSAGLNAETPQVSYVKAIDKNEFPQSNGENQSEQTSNIHPPSTVASNRNIIFEKNISYGRPDKGYTSARIGLSKATHPFIMKLLISFLLATASLGSITSTKFTKTDNIYGFTALDIDGNEVSMEKYRGHVCIILNVASE
ncbi:unnamed protein product [Lepeophtheirus salmonis]|uniref:(salmon louse) hypothetical protein n=1 Tax=Lepeophtheirus salmonis TaxID=72036 RepID=A0A7R8H110_LEPSM|nr:unnamed protein product [Lepeophtheirus salmonis]CAF2780178.1 unnamed protein product [Lepeophtheirus salmonis]